MSPRWMLPALLLAAACGPPLRDPIATERASTFGFPYVDPAVPGAPGVFGGLPGDVAGAPHIVYPLDGAMPPINIGAITLQWTRGASSSRVFRIALTRDDGFRYELYAPCTTTNCRFAPPPPA